MRRLLQRLAAWFDGVDLVEETSEQPCMFEIECDDCGMTYFMSETEWFTNPQSCPGCCRGLPRNRHDGEL